MQIPADASREDVEKIALADERTKKYVEGKQIIKTIVVPGRIINIVIK
jgi:leucyl-tRNA synthetase